MYIVRFDMEKMCILCVTNLMATIGLSVPCPLEVVKGKWKILDDV